MCAWNHIENLCFFFLFFSPCLWVLAASCRMPFRRHLIDVVRSLKTICAYQHPLLEVSGLERANLIDFHLCPPPPRLYTSQSPDGKRSFWSVSVLTGSQLALDMSMSSPVWPIQTSGYFSMSLIDWTHLCACNQAYGNAIPQTTVSTCLHFRLSLCAAGLLDFTTLIIFLGKTLM